LKPTGSADCANGSGSSRSPGIPGNAAITDGGTTDGSNDQELARLVNFDTGGTENPTSTQTAPTPRSEQQAGVATAAVFGGAVGFGRGVGNSESSSSNGQGGPYTGDGGDPDAGNPGATEAPTTMATPMAPETLIGAETAAGTSSRPEILMTTS
jgi:hypothetical protein